MKTTLLAVSGMSPAILTETLWALSGETPLVVPDEVVVITTSKGQEDIDQDLLTKNAAWGKRSVWETLRRDILSKADLPVKSRKLQLSVRVINIPDEDTGIRKPAYDLRTRDDNDEAADFIVRNLAEFCDAEDNHVIASIAGGRKTMGALLYAAMSLIGKETDRVTHVLVSEPFENCRGFFYPEQPVQKLEARPFGKAPVAVTALDARIQLTDLPFVPLRNKFTELNEPRRTFAGLVDAYSRAQRDTLSHAPKVSIAYQKDTKSAIFTVEGRPFKLTGRELLTADFLFERARQGLPHFSAKDDAVFDLSAFSSTWKASHPGHQAPVRFSAGFITADDFPKALNGIRSKLEKAGLSGAIPYLVPRDNRIGFDCKIV